jgi:hypothetical protein
VSPRRYAFMEMNGTETKNPRVLEKMGLMKV